MKNLLISLCFGLALLTTARADLVATNYLSYSLKWIPSVGPMTLENTNAAPSWIYIEYLSNEYTNQYRTLTFTNHGGAIELAGDLANDGPSALFVTTALPLSYAVAAGTNPPLMGTLRLQASWIGLLNGLTNSVLREMKFTANEHPMWRHINAWEIWPWRDSPGNTNFFPVILNFGTDFPTIETDIWNQSLKREDPNSPMPFPFRIPALTGAAAFAAADQPYGYAILQTDGVHPPIFSSPAIGQTLTVVTNQITDGTGLMVAPIEATNTAGFIIITGPDGL